VVAVVAVTVVAAAVAEVVAVVAVTVVAAAVAEVAAQVVPSASCSLR
jgi:hypothetical protein